MSPDRRAQKHRGPDGSRIDLSTQSRLSFFFNDVERRVVLHEGEAYFTVARGLTPFVVAAGLGMTTALGTAFSVEYPTMKPVGDAARYRGIGRRAASPGGLWSAGALRDRACASDRAV